MKVTLTVYVVILENIYPLLLGDLLRIVWEILSLHNAFLKIVWLNEGIVFWQI